MRKIRALFIAVAISLFLSSCGGGGPNTGSNSGNSGNGGGTPPPATLNLTGNWDLSAVSSVTANRNFEIGGSVTHSGNTLTGSFHVLVANNFCFSGGYYQGLSGTVTGTVNGSQVKFELTSQEGTKFTLTLTAADSNNVSGTYTISGGCAAADNGQATGFKVPSITAAWKGTVVIGSETANFTASLTQGTPMPAGNAFEGLLPISGSFTVTGSSCFSGSGTITGPNACSDLACYVKSSVLGGAYIVLNPVFSESTASDVALAGRVDKNGTTITGDVRVIRGTCSAGSEGKFTFTKQ